MTFMLLVFCFSAIFHDASSALVSDGVTLLSLLSHWTFVPPSINSTWNASDSNPCSWVGVQCDHAHTVASLNLTDHRIFGQLGPEIGQLYHLRTLVLASNGFTGKVPSELSNCSLLQFLDLSENSFSGQIPYSLKKLQNLRYMSLSSNLLTGEIPDSLFQIPYLEEVSLHSNLLSGPIPTNIGNVTQLLRLYVYGNQLSGTIPTSIGNCSKIEASFLNGNRLNGILPESLNNLNNLVYFLVRNNSLVGTIPLGSGSCKKLFILDLSLNVFSGGIPSGLGNCSALAEFAAANSNLVGTIPSSLGLLPKLSILQLPNNHLSGKIPPEIGNCRSLKKLHLYSNQLEGEIPDKLGMLRELEDLELSFNRLTGEIPISIWGIQSLKHILVHNNSLFGELPLEITKLKHLKNISLFDNQFSGVIPQSLGVNSSLLKLDFTNNMFTGNIPSNLCFGKQLRELNMGLNRLQGGIPSDVGRCATLRRLILNENNLTGSLPDFESNPNLRYMDISKNNISGPIPSSLENCTNLTVVNLSMNKLTGLIPSEVGKLLNLVNLDLAHNNLEGPLPPQLSNCTKMDRFDVGFNFLNGSIPSSLRTWTEVTTLILRENHFIGGIPGLLSEFKKLRELQLGGNLFGGKIPRSLGKLQNLFYGLNLSANELTGEIPLEIGNLEVLQSLDVSLNNLTGSLDVLDNLLSLIEVNISYNFFDGPVPKHLTKLLNSSPSSFIGNPHLCVSCSPSHGLNCTKTSYLKPCVYKSKDHIGISKFVIVIIELGSSIFVSAMLMALLRMYLRRRYMRVNTVFDEKYSILERGAGKIGFLYKDEVRDLAENQLSSLHDLVMKATENFNDGYIIGSGAHGIVYKVQLGPRQAFAVKKVVFGSNKRKCLSIICGEIKTLGNTKHRNLVTYGDYWLGKDYGLILYDYMENGSLHDVLHEQSPPPPLSWNVRFNIAVGIAQGLAYLHNDCIPRIVLIDKIVDSDLVRAFHNSEVVAKEVTAVLMLALRCTDRNPRNRPTMKDVIHFYEFIDGAFKFKRRCDNVDYGNEVDADVAPKPCDLTDSSSYVSVVSIDSVSNTQGDQHVYVHGESSRAAYLRQKAVNFPLIDFIYKKEADTHSKRQSSSLPQSVLMTASNLNHPYIIDSGAHEFIYKAQLGPQQAYVVKVVKFRMNREKGISIMLKEIETLGMFMHRNLVTYVDHWIGEYHGLILYEYMENGSLHHILHEKCPPPFLSGMSG